MNQFFYGNTRPYFVFALILATIGLLVYVLPVMIGMRNALGADLSIKGVYLNQPREAFVSSHPQANCFSFDTSICSWTDTLGGASGNFIATFDKDLLASLTITDFDATDFDRVIAALVTKFGKPTQTQSGVVTNAMGMRFDNRMCTWLGKGWELQMSKRSSSVLKSSFIYTTTKAIRDFNKSVASKKGDI